MDKLAEKLSGQDIIKANARAEAAEAERTRQEAEQYKAQLEELKENAREQRQAIDDTRKSLESLTERMNTTDNNVHDVGVQVYRNVQAVIEKSQNANRDEFKAIREQTADTLENIIKANEDQFSELKDANSQSCEEMNKKNASAFKEINRNFEEIKAAIEEKNNAVTPLLIVILIVSGVDLVVNILRMLGVF